MQLLVALEEEKVYVAETGMTTGWATHLARFYNCGWCIFMDLRRKPESLCQVRLSSGVLDMWWTILGEY